MSEDQYLSLADAAAQSPYSQEYLSLRARQGKLKAVKHGRNWVTTKPWLDAYLRQVDESQHELKHSTVVRETPAVSPTIQPAATRHSFEPNPFFSQPSTGARSLWVNEQDAQKPRKIGLLEEEPVSQAVKSETSNAFVVDKEVQMGGSDMHSPELNQESLEISEEPASDLPAAPKSREIPVTIRRSMRKQVINAGLSPAAMNRESQSVWFELDKRHESAEPINVATGTIEEESKPDIRFWPAPEKQAKRRASLDLQPILATALVGVFMLAIVVLNTPLQISTNIAAGFSYIASAISTTPNNEEASFAHVDANGTVAGASVDLEPETSVSRTIAAGVVTVINGLTQDDESLARNLSEWLTQAYDLPF